jgi:hypothetical protein
LLCALLSEPNVRPSIKGALTAKCGGHLAGGLRGFVAEQWMLNTESFLEELRKSFSKLAKKSPPVFAAHTAEEAAAELNVSQPELARMIATGQLLCTWVAGERIISRNEVLRAKALRIR